MSKQKKSFGSIFFDEMEEKKEIENKKRRKLNRTSTYSQPELLFLQFKPEAQELEKHKSKFDSQPCTGGVYKKPWKPPVKCSVEPDSFQFHKNKKLGMLSINKLDDNTINGCEKSTEDNSDIIEILSSPSHSPQSSSFTKELSESKENIIDALVQDTNNNVSDCNQENHDNNCNNNLVVCSPRFNKIGNGIKNEKELYECKKELVKDTLEGDYFTKNTNDDSSNNDDGGGDDGEKGDSYKIENNLLDKQVAMENHTESDTNNQRKDHSIREENNYSDHDDIINSIDLILSEGQVHDKDNSNTISKVIESVEKTVEEDEDNLADTIFDNSNSESEDEDGSIVNKTFNNKNIEQKEKSENSLTDADSECVKKSNSNDIVKHNLDNNDIDSDENTQRNKLLLQEEEFDLILQKHTSIKTDKESEKINKNNTQQNEGCKELDEEYSCLMLSNTQLLEIETSYYDSSFSSRTLNKSTKNNSVTVATQTECILELTDQCKPVVHLAPEQWQKMQDSQKKLRAVIQEIDRLNKLLLNVRQQVWPQRHM